jgi:hypothetical protein
MPLLTDIAFPLNVNSAPSVIDARMGVERLVLVYRDGSTTPPLLLRNIPEQNYLSSDAPNIQVDSQGVRCDGQHCL